MFTANEVREKFVNYFYNNNHIKISSSPLIPQNDPTLLFANAGMNQFKDNFTGKANPKDKRAVTIQKCVRAGGKHNDLENVGMTARHHTFFEMLGNFSFGDYFKEDAIKMAWDFLTNELKLSKDKLYVTVHKSDEQARQIWHKQEGVPLEKIFYRDDKDNFWEMGDTGPCGPCSEIFYDHGQEHTDGADTSDCILDDEGRYVEIWNLVFMQYEKFIEDGTTKRRELPNPSIDTGAGLERVCAAIQGKYWNYDTDVFAPILSAIENLSNKKYSDAKYTTSMRVVADHIRSSVMLITDGVIPSNEGRGYVLRRIIRRAIRHLEELGIKDISFYKLIPSVFETLGKEYPQNLANSDLPEKLLKLEEEKFRQTLKTGLDLINKEISKISGNKFDGKTAFKLYDTYGFPLDLTQTILAEKGIELNEAQFNEEMKKQKENSKAKSKFETNDDNIKKYYEIKEANNETVFQGYNSLNTKSKLVASLEEGEFTALIFAQTSFYPEGGGQVGDQGLIKDTKGNIVAKVFNTTKPVEGLIAHFCKLSSKLETNTEYILEVDVDTRALTARNHSATHLLQSALIEVLGKHVKQAGSRVDNHGLRFDFTHTQAVTSKELKEVEILVNKKIKEKLDVTASMMTKDEATAKGAMALFGEKYGNEVRVLEMGNFSLELCGGIHVQNTEEIALFSIVVETSLASGIRRIEAVSSQGAFNLLAQRSETLSNLERLLSSNSSNVLEKVENLQKEIKAKSKTIKELEDKIQSLASQSLFDDIQKLSNNLGLVKVNLKEGSVKDFRGISDKFTDKNKSDVLFLYKIEGDKISYLLRTEKSNKNINCSNIVKNAQEIVSGRGGGRPDMAQGSGESLNTEKFISEIINTLQGL